MRQCWRDFESLENWSRSLPPQEWWKNFLSDSGGVGFWHEAYLMQGGIEAIYDDVNRPIGLAAFAPTQPARVPMSNPRRRLGLAGDRRTREGRIFLSCETSLVPQSFNRIEIRRSHRRKHRADHPNHRQNAYGNQQYFRRHDQANVTRLGMLRHGTVEG